MPYIRIQVMKVMKVNIQVCAVGEDTRFTISLIYHYWKHLYQYDMQALDTCFTATNSLHTKQCKQ